MSAVIWSAIQHASTPIEAGKCTATKKKSFQNYAYSLRRVKNALHIQRCWFQSCLLRCLNRVTQLTERCTSPNCIESFETPPTAGRATLESQPSILAHQAQDEVSWLDSAHEVHVQNQTSYRGSLHPEQGAKTRIADE